MNTFELGNFTVGSGDPFFILGPCGLEEEDFAWRMARALKEIAEPARDQIRLQGLLRQSQSHFSGFLPRARG